MKRNGRHRDGAHAKRRRARIARRLERADEIRVFRALILKLMKFEQEAFARDYRPISPDLLADLALAFAE